MIKFDHSKLTIELVSLKTITTSLGGSITYVDENKSTADKEVYRRQEVPLAVARSFIMRTKKVTRYLKPVVTALVKYDGLVVCMERHPLAALGAKQEEGFDGKIRTWRPGVQITLEDKLNPLLDTDSRTWYFDGRYAYTFASDNIDSVVRHGQFMTQDGHFRKIVTQTIDLLWLTNPEEFAVKERSCLAFVTSRGVSSISPPIWKNLSDVGKVHVAAAKKAEAEADGDDDLDDDDEDGESNEPPTFTFDTIDQTMAVNLNFTLKAGQEIGKTFGYEHVEPLNLPRLMIELHTVNLPNVPLQIKTTYDVGIRFTHALAWLLGMTRRANTLQTYIMMRSLMKYLTKKGIFRNNTFDAAHVFKDGKTVVDVPVHNLDDLLNQEDDGQMSLAMILQQARETAKARKKNEHDIHHVGGLLNEE